MNEAELLKLLQGDPAGTLAKAAALAQTIVVPHTGGQHKVWESEARFQVCCCGRRWGKTVIAAKKALRECRKPNQVVWWIANTYKNTRRGYRAVVAQIPPGMLAKPAPTPTSNELILQFKNGTRMEFYSGENPDALAGEGVNYCVIDEAALIKENVWSQLIRPTLMDSRGGALMISTPRGFNWFHQEWMRGQDELEPSYESWRFPTVTNPHIHPDEVAFFERTMPLAVYEQEILAEFTSDAAAIFRKTQAAVRALAPPEGQVVMGIDLAKHHDFTVLSASRVKDRLPCFHDRFNEVSWPMQRIRIRAAVDELEAQGAAVTVGLDTTGIGDVVFDDLEIEGLDVVPINFGAGRQKEMMVMLLSADLERGEAFLLEEQRPEFDSYRYELTPTGRYKFSGPEGGHDDEVAAKMIEHWVMAHEGAPDIRLLGAGGGPAELPSGGDPAEAGLEEGEVEEVTPDSVDDVMLRDDVWGH